MHSLLLDLLFWNCSKRLNKANFLQPFQPLPTAELIGEQKEEDVTKWIQLLLTQFSNLTIIPIDVEVADRAAGIQLKHGFSLHEAL